MSQLSANTLPTDIQRFTYDRSTVKTGIVHFGLGNFHRAHQAVYIEDLLEQGETDWGITGVSLRSPIMQMDLNPQDYLYTLAVLGPETTDYRVIGAIQTILIAPNDPQDVIDLIANPDTHIVSSTITEKGYYLASGEVDFEQAALKAELSSLDTPTTIYGFLAAGLIQRFKTAPTDSKLTILCCDNISCGGERLRQGVHSLLRRHSPEALAWTKTHVAFISSMVDRVSPATDDVLRAQVLKDTGRRDARPVSAEPFTQWIIEDGFAGKRPAFDTVGAVFVEDIAPFEQMKLRYLNAGHTIASTLGYLSGDIYVHEAIERPDILKFMRGALYKNVLPHAEVPAGYDGAAYIEDVIKRFQNANLPYGNLQVGTDSSQKIQQRWFPTIERAVSQNANCSYFAFSLGAWVNFIHSALEKDVLNDPQKQALKAIKDNDIEMRVCAYLKIANADKFEFYRNRGFMTSVSEYAQAIKTAGIEQAVAEFLDSNSP